MSDPQPSHGDPEACTVALDHARELLHMEGSTAMRAMAQQQAALELLQARKFGASDDLLQNLLEDVINRCLEQSSP